MFLFVFPSSFINFLFLVPELNEYFRNMDLENGHITNATTSQINEILDRNRSSNQQNHHPWLKDETLIPCEFCKAPIDADNLVLHQVLENFVIQN